MPSHFIPAADILLAPRSRPFSHCSQIRFNSVSFLLSLCPHPSHARQLVAPLALFLSSDFFHSPNNIHFHHLQAMSDQAVSVPHLEPDLPKSDPQESSPKIAASAEEICPAETSTPEVSPTPPEQLLLGSGSSEELPQPTAPEYARAPSTTVPLAIPVRPPSRHRVNSRAVRNIVFRSRSSSPTKPGSLSKSAVPSIRSDKPKHKASNGEEVFLGLSFSSDEAPESPALSLREIRFPRNGKKDTDSRGPGGSDGPNGYFFTDPGKPTLTNTANVCALGDSSDLQENGYEPSDDGSTIRSCGSQQPCQQEGEHLAGNQPSCNPSGSRTSRPKDSSAGVPYPHAGQDEFTTAPWTHYVNTLSSFRVLWLDLIVASFGIVSALGTSTAKNLYATAIFDCRLAWALIHIWADFFRTILQAIHLSLGLWLGYLGLCCLKRLPENFVGDLVINCATALNRAWTKLCRWATFNTEVFRRPVSSILIFLWQAVVSRWYAPAGRSRRPTYARPDFRDSRAEDETLDCLQYPSSPHQSRQQIPALDCPEEIHIPAQEPAQLDVHRGSPKKAARRNKQNPTNKSPRHMSTGSALREMKMKGTWSPLGQESHVGLSMY